VYRASAGLTTESGERAVDVYDWVESQEVYEWITSLYWAITTMTTIGYGDISAYTQSERCVAVVVMILGCGFFAWSTGTITTLFTTQDSCKVRFKEKFQQIAQFMDSRELSKDTRTKILTYYGLRYPTMKVFDDEEILQDLPLALARQVKVELFCDVVNSCVLFQTLSTTTCNEVCMRLRTVYKSEDIQVTKEGDRPDALYIVRFGIVSMYARSRFLGNANPGEIFGENALLGLTPDGKRNRSTFAKTMCELCELRKEELHELLKIEHFRREIKVLVHSHLSSMEKRFKMEGHVKDNSFYCVDWNLLVQNKAMIGLKAPKTVMLGDTTPKQGAMLCTSCTVVINKIFVSSETLSKIAVVSAISKLQKSQLQKTPTKPTRNFTFWVVSCFDWAGEHYGPTITWSYPFLLNPDKIEEGMPKDVDWTSLTVYSVSKLHLKHRTNDWKSKAPIQVKLYRVEDPTYFEDAIMQGIDDGSLDVNKYGLQLLGSGEIPVDNFLNGSLMCGGSSGASEKNANVMIPMSSLNAEFKQIGMSIDRVRILPSQSRWWSVLDLLKSRGASDFFTMKQRNLVHGMRKNFDNILEEATVEGEHIRTDLRVIVKSVQKLNTQMTDLTTQLNELKLILLRDGPVLL